MHITTNTVRSTYFLYSLNCLYFIFKHLTVHSMQLSLYKFKMELFASFFLYLLQIRTFRQSLSRVENFTSTNRRSPQTYII